MEKTPTKTRRLTKKQKGFIKDYIETGNGTEAAMRNYNLKDRIVAKSVASENLAKPYIHDVILEALPDDLLAQKHLEGLEATHHVPVVGEEPDYAVRHKYLDSAYKIKGTYAPEKQAIVHAFVLPVEDKARIDNILEDNE